MEHKNKEKLDWIIASNIDKGIVYECLLYDRTEYEI